MAAISRKRFTSPKRAVGNGSTTSSNGGKSSRNIVWLLVLVGGGLILFVATTMNEDFSSSSSSFEGIMNIGTSPPRSETTVERIPSATKASSTTTPETTMSTTGKMTAKSMTKHAASESWSVVAGLQQDQTEDDREDDNNDDDDDNVEGSRQNKQQLEKDGKEEEEDDDEEEQPQNSQLTRKKNPHLFGQEFVQRSYDETWSKFVSICTPERIRKLELVAERRKNSMTDQQQQRQPKQPSPVLVSPQMSGLRLCLQYILQLHHRGGKADVEEPEEEEEEDDDENDDDKVVNINNNKNGKSANINVQKSPNLIDTTTWPWWMRTMIRDMEKPRSGLYGIWHQLQFDHPRNLELCVYEKGGTKKFRNAHCLNVNNDDASSFKNARQQANCYLKQRQFDTNDVTDRAVFLRDPLDRFLSGFLDKCVRRADNVDHCEPSTVFFNESTSPVADMLRERRGGSSDGGDDSSSSSSSAASYNKKWFFDMYVDTLGLKFNMHFFPQALQCGGLYHSLDKYNYVGSLGNDFYRDLTTLTKKYPPIEDDFEQTFKLSKRGGRDNMGGVETGAANQVLEYYTPRTVRRVLQYYAIDYITLNLTVPLWAEDMLREDEEQHTRSKTGSYRR